MTTLFRLLALLFPLDHQLTVLEHMTTKHVQRRRHRTDLVAPMTSGNGDVGVAFSQIMPDETAASAVGFLKAALAYYKSLGVAVERVMTDNGSCYKSTAFARTCKRLKLKHIRTKPYTPKTNGKAERFIQTALREWAYAQAYPTSDHRAEELPIWLHRYNWHRPHGSLKSQPPISRLSLAEHNLLRLHN